jgi:hypothetical protein
MDFSKGRGGKGRGRIEMWARGVAQVIAWVKQYGEKRKSIRDKKYTYHEIYSKIMS